MKCNYCGSQLEVEVAVCPICGQNTAALVKEKKETPQDNDSRIKAFMDSEALTKLGKAHMEGIGVKQNFNLAYDYLYKGALKGNSEAMFCLYELLIDGLGCDKDVDRATWWLAQSAQLGNIEARLVLAEWDLDATNLNLRPENVQDDNDLKKVINKVQNYCVELSCFSNSKTGSSGSGCILSPNYFVTNAHVVIEKRTGQPYREINVTFNKATSIPRLPASVIYFNSKEDLALCAFIDSEVGGEDFPPLTSAHNLELGDRVFTIGNALGRGLSLSTGVIARELMHNAYGRSEVIQTDMSINGGNSGGALFNMNGEIIGLMTFVPCESGREKYGMSFAITSDTISTLLSQVVDTNK